MVGFLATLVAAVLLYDVGTVRKPELVVSLPGEAFSKDRPIILTCQFRNGSTKETFIWRSGFFSNHCVVVRNERGTEMPLTVVGQRRRAAFSPGESRPNDQGDEVPRRKNYRLNLQPGESQILAGEGAAHVDLTELYDLKEGRYSLSVTYEESQHPAMRITSKAVYFEVRH